MFSLTNVSINWAYLSEYAYFVVMFDDATCIPIKGTNGWYAIYKTLDFIHIGETNSVTILLLLLLL